jgi:hypothetical protein
MGILLHEIVERAFYCVKMEINYTPNLLKPPSMKSFLSSSIEAAREPTQSEDRIRQGQTDEASNFHLPFTILA